MSQTPLSKIFRNVDCEIRQDILTRQLYSTDASIYQIEPMAVAFPRNRAQTSAVMRAASDAGIAITPRGAGTGLAGGAVGSGLIIDLARYTRWIDDLDVEQRTVRVGPGVVLDQLNEFLRPHNLTFGPDVATSSRATLGGMISNNSSGARAPIYGTTIDHVESVEIVMPDGKFATVGPGSQSLPSIRRELDALIESNAELIRQYFPDVLVKRWPAYALDDCLNHPGNLCKIVTGSEGTLAAIVAATLRLTPPPRDKGLGVIFFATVEEAMQATVSLLDLKPAAIEHVDKVLFDQTRGQLEFAATRELLGLDQSACGAFLIVEFYDDVADRLAELQRRNMGLRTLALTDSKDMLRVWGLRKRGLSLLSGCKGPAKPIAGVEDVAVRPERLPDYVAAVKSFATGIGLEMSFYGHAASGLLHIRPVVNLHREDSIKKYRQLAIEISHITKSFHGSLTGEHGVGIARAEFMTEHLGDVTLDIMRRIKAMFDPKGVMNPGKVFPEGGHRIDSHLRYGAGHSIELPFEPVLAFASKDESFVGNLEQCNGCGDCRKDPPVMCPTFTATGEEIMSTRGRANTIRAVLEGRISGSLNSPALEEALSNCLSCKACKKECPSNVDMALLKAELMHARHREHGVRLLERFVSRFDLLGRIGTAAPTLMNAMLNAKPVRMLMEKAIGLAADRPLPLYAKQRFELWFNKRSKTAKATRGPVYLWNDCTTRFFEPEIGRAAVRVLETAGYEVRLTNTGACCGRPAFSVGRLDVAGRFGAQNVRYFAEQKDDAPIIFLEPSCYSMYAGDYEELKIPNARQVAERCLLFEQFIYNLLAKDPGALKFKSAHGRRVAVHAHCHAKALTKPEIVADIASRVDGCNARMLDTGCCGMAGSFGALRDKYALSVAVAKPLVDCVNKLAPDTALISSGTSCRQQITHLTAARPVHFAQWLADAIE